MDIFVHDEPVRKGVNILKRAKNKEETLNKIIFASRQLFSEKGYENTTIKDITDQSGIAKGTFFNYFPTKADIIMHIQADLFFDRINELHEKNAPFAPRILALVKEIGDNMFGNNRLVKSALQVSLGDTAASTSRKNVINNISASIPIFEKGQNTGEFTSTIPPEIMARTAVQLYLGVLFCWSLDTDTDSLGEQLLITFNTFINGILNKKS